MFAIYGHLLVGVFNLVILTPLNLWRRDGGEALDTLALGLAFVFIAILLYDRKRDRANLRALAKLAGRTYSSNS